MKKTCASFVFVLMTIGLFRCEMQVNVGILLQKPDEWIHNALEGSLQVINATKTVAVHNKTFYVGGGAIWNHATRCNFLVNGLSQVSYILEPYKVDPISCVLSEILNKSLITLGHEHNRQCRNVISMRPEPAQLNQALIAMIKDHQPREVAVIIEEGLGEEAADIMAHDYLLNKLFFHLIGTVDFSKPSTIEHAVKNLKASAIAKVLLVVQAENIQDVTKKLTSRHLTGSDYTWYTPYVDFSKVEDKSVYEGVCGLQLLVDNDKLNETMCELKELQEIYPNNRKLFIDPLLHDALEAVASAEEEFKARCLTLPKQKDKQRCKIKRTGDKCGSIVDFMKRVFVQRGITGDVKFTLSGYRNITNLIAKEISNGKENQCLPKSMKHPNHQCVKSRKCAKTFGKDYASLGVWSTACDKFIWNPRTEDAEDAVSDNCQPGSTTEDGDSKLTVFKPRKRRLKIVTYIEEPFMMLRNGTGNDRFHGFLKELLERLKQDLDFEYVLHEVKDKTYGVRLKNGTWNGLIGELINKQADIAAAPMTITSSRQEVVEFTKPYMDFSMALIMEKPKEKSLDLFGFMRPFHLTVWVSLAAVTSVTALFIYLIDKYSKHGYKRYAKEGKPDIKGDEFRFGNCVWFVGSTLLQQGAELTPMSAPGRVLGAAFWFYALILISTYTANLAAVFATTKIESKINSIQDLADQEEILYGVLSSGTTYDFFSRATIPLYQKMFDTMNRQNSFSKSTTSAIQRVRSGGYAYLTDEPVLQYNHQRQPCNTFLLENLLMAKGYGLGLQVNSEWTQLISVRILKLKEEGFIESLRLKYWDERSQCVPDSAKSKKTTSLDIYSMAGVFIVLAVGAGIAFVILFLENKASSWLRGRCSGCLAQELVFQKQNSQNTKPTNNKMLTYMDFPDDGPNTNSMSNRKRARGHFSDSPKSTESGRLHDMAANYKYARGIQYYDHNHDRESTL